jgi:hypothetical protein
VRLKEGSRETQRGRDRKKAREREKDKSFLVFPKKKGEEEKAGSWITTFLSFQFHFKPRWYEFQNNWDNKKY